MTATNTLPRGKVCGDATRCHLRKGAVVRYVGDYGTSGNRGIVQVAHIQAGMKLGLAGLWGEGDAVIQLAPGITRVTNMHDEWEIVPDEEHTTEERVRAAWLTWQKPEWADPSEQDSLEFRVLAALLTPAEHDEVFGDYSWPVDLWELSTTIAQLLDERITKSAVTQPSLPGADADARLR